ncbi:MAG: transcription elongation factor GreB, partial [Moraxellaceae bacterium]|nr:transcription elongation factor GreB [Moraxellaceae bacterium]
MSRYRPPSDAPPPTALITPEGYKTMSDELDWLWRVRRPEVTRAVSEAAAMGDRSENAEYIYGKKLLREIDRRVRFLTKRIEVLKVVDQKPT